MKRFILKLTPSKVKKVLKKIFIRLNIYKEPNEIFLHKYVRSYSQHQEDLIIDAILSSKKQGFYVDIGANHPEVLSNTKRFYDRGWTGINVEPITENFQLFCSSRERDINLNFGVGAKKGEMTFYHANKSRGVYSGFDKKNVLKYAKNHEIVTRKIPVYSLNDIFTEYLEENKFVDFISIDVEGVEIEVLKGNRWNVFRPYLIIIEFGDNQKKITDYLKEQGYHLIFRNIANGIFIDSKTSNSCLN